MLECVTKDGWLSLVTSKLNSFCNNTQNPLFVKLESIRQNCRMFTQLCSPHLAEARRIVEYFVCWSWPEARREGCSSPLTMPLLQALTTICRDTFNRAQRGLYAGKRLMNGYTRSKSEVRYALIFLFFCLLWVYVIFWSSQKYTKVHYSCYKTTIGCKNTLHISLGTRNYGSPTSRGKHCTVHY